MQTFKYLSLKKIVKLEQFTVVTYTIVNSLQQISLGYEKIYLKITQMVRDGLWTSNI